MKCPECGNTSTFRFVRVLVECEATYVSKYQDGSWSYDESKGGDTEESGIARECDARCLECRHEALVTDFDDGDMPEEYWVERRNPNSELLKALKDLEHFASYVAFRDREADWGKVIASAKDAIARAEGRHG